MARIVRRPGGVQDALYPDPIYNNQLQDESFSNLDYVDQGTHHLPLAMPRNTSALNYNIHRDPPRGDWREQVGINYSNAYPQPFERPNMLDISGQVGEYSQKPAQGITATTVAQNQGNIGNTWANFKDTVGNWGKGIMDNSLIGKIAAGFDATNPNAFNYNPRLQEQIDFMKSKGMYGIQDQSGLNKITSGALRGQHLQSALGSNDLIGMYDKQIARHAKTFEGFDEQWADLKEDDPVEFERRKAIHEKRKKDAEFERDAIIAHQQKLSDARAQKEKDFVTQNLGVTAADAATSGKGFEHTKGQTSEQRGTAASRMGGGSRQAKSGSQVPGGSGRTDKGWGWAQGGRIGLRTGGDPEIMEDDLTTMEFMQDQNIPFGEQVEADPFDLRIQELMGKGLSYEEAYDIAEMEFQELFAEGSEQGQGIASLV